MKRFTMFACLALALVFALSSFAGEQPRFAKGSSLMHFGGGVEMNKAERDTIYMMAGWGSGATWNGQFEDEFGAPNWNGWTHRDVTQRSEQLWNAADYNTVNGSFSAWCGSMIYPACTPQDPEGGYGNGWNEIMQWVGTVADNSVSTTVRVTATINHDSEPAYDFSYLTYLKFDQPAVDLLTIDDTAVGVAVDQEFTMLPADYLGAGGDQVIIQWRFTSDSGWSDEDCSFSGQGAIQVDDVTIYFDGAPQYSEDFETGTLGQFEVIFPIGVGDFAKIWTNLEDADPCISNYSPVVAFIDDGLVVPGTNGSDCINHCYGPNGYIVTTTGGLAGIDAHVECEILTPIMPWEDMTQNGGSWIYSVYRHEDLSDDSPGIFYQWGVRSALDEAGIATAGWNDRNLVYYGGPDWFRDVEPLTDLLEPGRTHVQCRLTVIEYGYWWTWEGDDGYPAPYFDNCQFIIYPTSGPGLSTREIDIANDNFPSSGEINYTSLGENSVRFDMANNISLTAHERNDPGDSICFDIVPVRAGSNIDGLPRIYYKINPNPLFDAFRTSGLPNEGFVEGVEASSGDVVVPDRYAFDLPDSNFLFPGDILHYYIWAQDNLQGDREQGIIPADTTGFDNFSDDLKYSPAFTVRALPTIWEASPGVYAQPEILWWNDFGNRGLRNEWILAYRNLGHLPGRDYDEYYTNAPSSALSNGIGGRATDLQLAGYDHMLYSVGDLTMSTISNGDFNNDAGNDVGVLDLWMRQGDKDMFLSGDDLIADLVQSGSATNAFITDWIDVTLVGNDLRTLIGNNTTPRVLVESGNPVFTTVNSWVAYGGCLVINTFDAVTVADAAVRLAEFGDPAGNPGGYPYAAAVLNTVGTNNTVYMPYDLGYVYNDPDETLPEVAFTSARTRLLSDVLQFFGKNPNLPDVSGVAPAAEKFAARNYPNPFNPTTKIEYSLPSKTSVEIAIYSVRGAKIKTLVNEVREAGPHSVMWDGTNDQGSGVASGVYFFKVKTPQDEINQKMMLLK